MFELSTVFLNVHWFCDKTGLSGSKIQWINGMFLLLAFFAVRLVFGTITMFRFVVDNFSRRAEVGALYYFYSFAATGLGLLNFYWYSIMIRSVMSRFKKKSE
jgi:hypothetical protein